MLRLGVEVVLIETEGRARSAEIEVDGQRLVVEDGVSSAERAADPGPIGDARFQVILGEPASWERAVSKNPAREQKLERLQGWRYRGYGEIVAIDPVRIDLCVLALQLDLATDTPDRVGQYAVIEIDRIRVFRTPA